MALSVMENVNSTVPYLNRGSKKKKKNLEEEDLEMLKAGIVCYVFYEALGNLQLRCWIDSVYVTVLYGRYQRI